MKQFIFWAQALDNTSPDHVEMRGQVLSPDDAVEREKAASTVADIIRRGSAVYQEGHFKLTVCKNRFVLEVPSVQRDNAGRVAPLVCCGEYRSRDLDILEHAVASALDRFAQGIEREIDSSQRNSIGPAFAVLKKKSVSGRRGCLMALGAAVILLIVVVVALGVF